jgi:hypothetical protein
VGHYIANVRDIEFNLFEVLTLGEVLDSGAYGDLDSDTVRTMLDEVARLAEGAVAESFVDADRNPPEFDPTTHEISVPGPLAKSVQAVKDAGVAQATLAAGASDRDRPFYQGKIAASKFFAHNMLPLLTAVREIIDSIDGEVMELDNAAF